MVRVVTRLPFDTFGISARLRDYTVETVLRALDAGTTLVAMIHFYATPTLRSRLFDCIARDTIARKTQDLLNRCTRWSADVGRR